MGRKRILEKRIRWKEKIVSALPAGEGCILFSSDRKQYGYMDANGNIISPPVWMAAQLFHDGLAGVYRKGEGWGYINPQGDMVLSNRWYNAKPFCEGRALVNGTRGKIMIDKRGDALLAEERWAFCDSFHDGRAIIGRKSHRGFIEECDKYGFMDMDGRVVVKPKFDECENFSEGLAAVRKGGLWGYVDKDGRMAIEPKWDMAGSFSEGRAIVLDGGFHLGMIDRRGELAIPMHYNSLSFFSEGLAAFGQGDKHGFINRRGEVVIPAEWDNCLPASFCGLRAVQKQGKWKLLWHRELESRIVMDGWDELILSGEDYAIGRRDGEWWIIRVVSIDEAPLLAGA